MPTTKKPVPQMSILTVVLALIAILPATIASVAALIVAFSTNAKVEEVHKATNSMKDALVAAALLAGHTQGVADEKAAVERSKSDAKK